MTGAVARSVRVRRTARLGTSAVVEASVPWWPTGLTEALQRRRIAGMVQHAHATVPFYRDAMRSAGLEPDDIATAQDLARLPPIDTDTVQADPEAFVSTAYPRERRTALATSGSTDGVRRMVLWDDDALLMKVARAQRDRGVLNALAGERLAGTLVRELSGRGETSAQRLLARIGRDDGTHGRLSILPLDFRSRTQRTFLGERTLVPAGASNYSVVSPAAGHVPAADALESRRPRIVFSFGSYVEGFLKYLETSGRDVPLPRVWVYMGDCVGARGRELAEACGCVLYSVYASTEAGAIGFQCERTSGFHLNLDLCVVRIADDEGGEVPRGEAGDIVVSNLQNRAMVLLNYRQGDRGVLGTEPCRCGRRLPVLARLDGRRSEVVQTADGVRLSALELEGLFREPLRSVRQGQLCQREPGQVTWRLDCPPDTDLRRVRAAMLARGREVLGEGTHLEIEFSDRIHEAASGKQVRVIR